MPRPSMIRPSSVVLSLSLLAFAIACEGCDRRSEAKADAPSPAAVASTAVSTAPRGSGVPWASIPDATANLLPNMSIPERFRIEASSRPTGLTPNADAVLAAIAAEKVAVADTKQHLGSPFGARYCVGTRVTSESATLLHVSVCEFVSSELAKSAASYSAQSMGSIENRTVHAHKQLTLTIREERKAPENDAAAAKVVEAFERT